MRLILTLLLVSCTKKESPPPPAPASGSAPVAAPIVVDAAAIDAEVDAKPAIVCLPSGISAELTDGMRVKYCARERPPSKTKHCIAIDGAGMATQLADETAVETNQDFELIAPAGWTAKKVEDDEQNIVAIEVCKDEVCTKLALAKKKDLDLDGMLATVAIAPDGKTVAIDRGMYNMSKSRLELHTITPPKLVRELSIPKDGCTNVAGFAGDYYFLQGIADCINLGGSRALASSDGKIKKVFEGMVSTNAPFKYLGGTNWLFGMQEGVEVWDVATLKRVAKIPDFQGDIGVTDDHVLLTVDRDGNVTRYDAELKVLGTTKIATCGS